MANRPRFSPYRRPTPSTASEVEQSPAEHRIAHALEHIAEEMSQMNERIDRLIEAIEGTLR
jgi:hypothetical protein